MKETKVTQDDRQTRSTIPQEYVRALEITKEDMIGWSIDEARKELFAILIQNPQKSETDGNKQSSKDSVKNPEEQISG